MRHIPYFLQPCGAVDLLTVVDSSVGNVVGPPLLSCRFTACYAQVVNTWVFWGSWCALVLMYWEVRAATATVR